MSIYQTMLSKKLSQAEPSLDLKGADRKVLLLALQDFTNYLKFIAKDGEVGQVGIVAGGQEKSLEDIEAFLYVWSGLWLKKWKERFCLSIVQTGPKAFGGKVAQSSAKAEADCCLKLQCRDEVIEMVTMALIRNGEICGTNVIAQNIFMTEAGKLVKETSIAQQSVAVLNKSLCRAREVSRKAGPIVKIQVEKNYYCHVNQ